MGKTTNSCKPVVLLLFLMVVITKDAMGQWVTPSSTDVKTDASSGYVNLIIDNNLTVGNNASVTNNLNVSNSLGINVSTITDKLTLGGNLSLYTPAAFAYILGRSNTTTGLGLNLFTGDVTTPGTQLHMLHPDV